MEELTIISISKKEFKITIQEIVSETIKEALKNLSQDKLLTQEEAADYLSINKVTLIRWAKLGYVTPIEKPGRTYYLLSDLHKTKKERGKTPNS